MHFFVKQHPVRIKQVTIVVNPIVIIVIKTTRPPDSAPNRVSIVVDLFKTTLPLFSF